MKSNLVKNMAKCLAATGLTIGLISTAFAAPVLEIEPNDSISTAQNIDSFFDLSFDQNIENFAGFNTSTSIAHAEVQGVQSNTASFDYFSFQATAGSTAMFDIDCGMVTSSGCVSLGAVDTWLNLFNPSGMSIAINDNYGLLDSGSSHGFDSFIELVLPSITGLYTIRVGRCCFGPVQVRGDYVLNVSVQGHAVTAGNGNTVPEPAPLALLGLGLMGLGLARRRKSEV